MACLGLMWRGELCSVDLGPPMGHEPGLSRSALGVSTDITRSGARVVIAVPVAPTPYGLRCHTWPRRTPRPPSGNRQ